MARVVILSRKSKWGLDADAKLVEQIFREAQALKWLPVATIDHLDSYQFTNPKPVDIQIHLEVPCRQAWPWAKVNIVVVNPEWWPKTAWNWVFPAADYFVFKSPHVAQQYPEIDPKKCIVIPWRGVGSSAKTTTLKQNKVLYLVGDSRNKLEAAKVVLKAWKAEWPPLEIWGSPTAIAELPVPSHITNVTTSSVYRSAEEKQKAQYEARYHCVASVAEGFGYTMAECAAAGSLPLWVQLPVQEYVWGTALGATGCIPPAGTDTKSRFREPGLVIREEDVGNAGDALFSLGDAEYSAKAAAFQKKALEYQKQFREEWKRLLKSLALRKLPQPFMPRRIPKEELPHVAVITLTHNRPKWWANMSRNILLSDYPSEKLTWVIVDDSDGMGRIDAQVQSFRDKTPQIALEYVSLSKKVSVGEKRNRGCAAALARNPATEVFVMMDDDDHYPKSSVEARVTYLKDMKRGCVYCSTLPMYDCKRFISAMNVPPMDLAPAERVSEATLAFTKVFWEERHFSDVSVAEGEAFVENREAATSEIAPEGIIVSFLHGKNSTARRVPESQEANGCHYGFPDEYFMYLCEMGEA
jgi:hypothetical protein